MGFPDEETIDLRARARDAVYPLVQTRIMTTVARRKRGSSFPYERTYRYRNCPHLNSTTAAAHVITHLPTSRWRPESREKRARKRRTRAACLLTSALAHSTLLTEEERFLCSLCFLWSGESGEKGVTWELFEREREQPYY